MESGPLANQGLYVFFLKKKTCNFETFFFLEEKRKELFLFFFPSKTGFLKLFLKQVFIFFYFEKTEKQGKKKKNQTTLKLIIFSYVLILDCTVESAGGLHCEGFSTQVFRS